jgi:hypothetical protein
METKPKLLIIAGPNGNVEKIYTDINPWAEIILQVLQNNRNLSSNS